MQGYWELKRKEQRVGLRIQLRLQGTDGDGRFFDEKCTTENVSKSGALFITRQRLLLGSTLRLEAFGKFRCEVIVRLIVKDSKNPELFKVGVEFNGPVSGWIVY